MDLMSSMLGYIALNLVVGSVWEMTRGSVIITTAIFSKIFLKKDFTKSSIFGCVLAFIGITWVQLFSILLKTNSGSDQRVHTPFEQFIGFMLLLVGLLFNTIVYISEKMIFNKYSIHPFKMVFLQGVYGFIGMVIVIFGISFYNCPEDSSIKQKCMFYNGQYYIESVSVFFDQISKNTGLLFFVIGLICSVSVTLSMGVTISKMINPVARALANMCRTFLVWIICILLTVTIGKYNKQYIL